MDGAWYIPNTKKNTTYTDSIEYNHKKTELKRKSNQKVHNPMAKSNDKTHTKRMDKNCHIPDLVQAFSNGFKALNLIRSNLQLIQSQ